METATMYRTDPEALPHFEVRVSPPDAVRMNHEYVAVAAGESPYQVILAQLHSRALAYGTPVLAAVYDGLGDEPFSIEVAPDGRSRMLTASALSVPSADDTAHDAPSSSRPTQSAFRAKDPRDGGLPALVPCVARELAAALRELVTAQYGLEHPLVQESYSLDAYVATMSGDHTAAARLLLAVSRVRCRQDDPRAARDVMRSAAAWQRMPRGPEFASVGPELIGLWYELEERGLLGLGDEESQAVKCRLRTLVEDSDVTFSAPTS
ncbi:hypothetical protein [Streptomyces parvulus]|uniref:hypothetical protein n=1 Tax=Streptomyces parvulus TaxID=146923 RepID=UPI00341E33C0